MDRGSGGKHCFRIYNIGGVLAWEMRFCPNNDGFYLIAIHGLQKRVWPLRKYGAVFFFWFFGFDIEIL